ncbi:cytochrome P450 [Streptomyces sp. SYSU K217416]
MRIDLTDESQFADNSFWSTFAWLRTHDPVHRHADPPQGAFWALTRRADIAAVYADHVSFSSRSGMRLGSDPRAIAPVAQRMMIVSDPPAHTRLKRVLSLCFGPARTDVLEAVVRKVVRAAVADAIEAGSLDFVETATRIPNHVICALMGVPRSDWEWLGATTTQAFEGADDEVRSTANAEIFLYFEDLLRERREGDGDDFISQAARAVAPDHATGAERPLTDEEIILNASGVLAGGNETTRYAAAGGLLALAQHPDQWRMFRDGGQDAVPHAVEEVLRWTTPGMHTLRTVTRPVTMRGTRLDLGDRVVLWNGSANRDEAAFDHPDRFSIMRRSRRHVTFGSGVHICIGARLARMELSALLRELLARVARVEQTGDIAYTASNFTWGLTRLPVRLIPR